MTTTSRAPGPWGDPRTRDVVLAGAMFLVAATLGAVSTLATADGGQLSAASFVLLLLAALPLLVRRSHPRGVLVACAVVEVAHLALLPELGPLPSVSLPVATAAAAFTAVDRCGLRRTWALLLVATVALTGVSVLATDGERQTVDLLLAYHSVVIASGVGFAVRNRRGRLEHLERRAEEAERGRQEEARRQVGAERVRIARELHDVLAHHITLVNAQAGVAEYLVDSDPQAARTALRDITRHTRGALDELRATVGLLRAPDDVPDPRSAPEVGLRPVPGLDRLDELLTGFRSAGSTISVTAVGEGRALPPVADLAAYRIVQEALTNARKHAPGAAVSLTLTWSEDTLDLLVVNGPAPDGHPAAVGTGHGLLGMRERALAAGGTLRLEQPRAGGYVVAARLPVSGPVA